MAEYLDRWDDKNKLKCFDIKNSSKKEDNIK
jgi:hypothetical protein